MMQIGIFVGLIVIGTCGLVASVVMNSNTSSRMHLESMRAIDAKRFAAQEELIAALGRKADAFENLANEQEKTLMVYRQVVVPNDSMGVPAGQLGGGNGR